jgi:hypothetical protein
VIRASCCVNASSVSSLRLAISFWRLCVATVDAVPNSDTRSTRRQAARRAI